MATATSVRPTAVQTCTTSTVSATATTRLATPAPHASTSEAIISTAVAIILARVDLTGCEGNAITEGAILLGVVVLNEVECTSVIIAIITIFTEQATK